MFEILAMLGVVLLVVCFLDWRSGVLIAIGVGFAQDPLRKLVEGEPIYFVVLVGVFFGAAFLGALRDGMPLTLRPVYAIYPALRTPMNLFLLIVAVQILVTLIKTGSIMLAGIGAIAYYAPIAGLMLAFRYGARGRNVTRLLHVYVFGALAMSTGIYLEVSGVDWRVLGQVGQGIFIYPDSGGVLKLPSGFLRAPENAAWHASTAICFLIILTTCRAWTRSWLWAGVIGVVLLGAILLTGRRKMVIELLIFGMFYLSALHYCRTGAGKLAGFLAVFGVVAIFLTVFVLPDVSEKSYQPYVERTTTVFDEATDRFKTMTYLGVQGSIANNGFFGAGAGLGSQGAQHFGGGVRAVGASSEGGLGKIVAELGVPALLVFAWMGFAYVWSVWRGLINTNNQRDSGRMAVAAGFASFLCANLAVYTAAMQVFGDPFVLIVIGLTQGFLLASLAPGLAESRRRRLRAARPSEPPAVTVGPGEEPNPG